MQQAHIGERRHLDLVRVDPFTSAHVVGAERLLQGITVVPQTGRFGLFVRPGRVLVATFEARAIRASASARLCSGSCDYSRSWRALTATAMASSAGMSAVGSDGALMVIPPRSP